MPLFLPAASCHMQHSMYDQRCLPVLVNRYVTALVNRYVTALVYRYVTALETATPWSHLQRVQQLNLLLSCWPLNDLV